MQVCLFAQPQPQIFSGTLQLFGGGGDGGPGGDGGDGGDGGNGGPGGPGDGGPGGLLICAGLRGQDPKEPTFCDLFVS